MDGQLLYILIMLAEAVAIIFLIILNVRLNKKNKSNNEMIDTYKEKLREDELTESLKNEYFKQNKAENDWKNVPYETTFTEEDKVRTTSAICVHLECIGRVSTRKYLINIADELYLGRGKNNGVVFEEDGIDLKQLHFVRQAGELYVENISPYVTTLFVRKGTKYELTDSLVKLNDGDELVIGESRVIVKLI